jgi:hypothetical protein
MKILQVLVLILGLTVFANAQRAEKIFVLGGTVYDSNKALVVSAELTAKNKDGRIYKTFSNEDGIYSIKLPFGKYTLKFTKDGFKDFIVINFENFSVTEESFDVDFIVGHCADCNGDIYGERDQNELKPTVVDYKKLKNKRKNNK